MNTNTMELNPNMMELNLDELELISGGWNWKKSVFWGVFGTVIGASIGAQIGGAPGAVAGAVIGNLTGGNIIPTFTWGIAAINNMVISLVCYLIGEVIRRKKA